MNLQMYNPKKVKGGGGGEAKKTMSTASLNCNNHFYGQKRYFILRNPQEFRIHIITLSDNT